MQTQRDNIPEVCLKLKKVRGDNIKSTNISEIENFLANIPMIMFLKASEPIQSIFVMRNPAMTSATTFSIVAMKT